MRALAFVCGALALGCSTVAPGATNLASDDVGARDAGAASDADFVAYASANTDAGKPPMAATEPAGTCQPDAASGVSPMAPSDAGALTAPIVLAANQKSPDALTVDDQNVFWVNLDKTEGGVFSVPKAGGPVTALYQGPMRNAYSLGHDGVSLYFATPDQIVSVPVGGGAAKILASSGPASGVAVANGEVYWIELPAAGDPTSLAIAKKVSVGGGVPVTIPFPDAANPLHRRAEVVTASTDAVYVGFADDILRIPLDGGAPTWTALGQVQAFAVDATQLYFTTGDSAVESVSKSCGPRMRLARGLAPFGVAVDDSAVYFTDELFVGRVLKIAKVGGPVTVLADQEPTPYRVAVDTDSVYWIANAGGLIKKTAK
jgi:hypothetical protein